MEKVLKIRDVMYINDSKATNVDSAWYALDSMTTPVIWIAGGKDKGNDYSPLYDLVKDGMSNKMAHISDDSREKLGETLGKIVNEGSNGLICILL